MITNSFPRAILFLALVFTIGAQPRVDSGEKLSKVQAFTWNDGIIKYSTITNCVSIIQGVPYSENGVGTYVGFLADPSTGKPAPNVPYYLHVVVAGLGNACSGTRAYVDIALPSNTSLAISATNKIYYLYDNVSLPSNESPQTLSPSPYNSGAYQILSVDAANANTWPIPQGRTLEIQIPVITTTSLTSATFQANVRVLDGNDSPWLRPQNGIFVFSGTPSIIYATPSTISITTTTARSEATLFSGGNTGTGYFDLGTTTAYELFHDAVTITSGSTSYNVWDEWGPPSLKPGTVYHWRFTFTSGTQTYYGTDQTFTTKSEPVANHTEYPITTVRDNKAQGTAFDILGRNRPQLNSTGRQSGTGVGVHAKNQKGTSQIVIYTR